MSLIAESTLTQPGVATVLFGLGLLSLVISIVPAFSDLEVPTARRIYWTGWVGAATFLGAALTSRGLATGIAAFGVCIFVAVLRAYFVTPYLKLGGRVLTFFEKNAAVESTDDLRPRISTASSDPADRTGGYVGGVSDTKQWWLMVVLMIFGAVSILVIGCAWQSALIAAFLTLLAAIAGVDDATRRLPPARGQKTQATLVAAASLPMAALPVLTYLVGFQLGKRRPMGRGKHSATDEVGL